MKNYKIAIIGAGVTGLAAAAFLNEAGYVVKVFEKFKQPRALGAGLLLQPTGLMCLKKLGVDQSLINLGAKIGALSGKTASGKCIFDLSYADLAPHFFGLGIHRGALFQILYQKVVSLNIPIINDFDVCSIDKYIDNKYVINSIKFEHSEAFDIVIDSSGMHSVIREKYANVKLSRVYPYGAIWGVSKDQNNLINQEILQQRYVQAKTMIGILPIGKAQENDRCNHTTFFWSLKNDDYIKWKNEPLENWKNKVKRLWPEIDYLTSNFHIHSDLIHSIYSDVILSKFYQDRIVFMGDAAHSTSPQLGQGANLGLMDALSFCECLKTNHCLNDAINEYDLSRKRHVHFYQSASRCLTPFFQSDSIFPAWLRDTFFGSMGKIPFIRQQMLEILFGVKSGLFKRINLE